MSVSTSTFNHILALVLSVFTLFYSCDNHSLPAAEAPDCNNTELHHDYTRQQPYPKENNEIYLNPVPLIIPESAKTGELVQFALSRHADFDETATLLSTPAPWCMYNPHRILESGTWYWRFRNLSADGTSDSWSETYSFKITDNIPQFVTPDVGTFKEKLPSVHPRLYLYLDQNRDAMRASLPSHPEYKALTSRAEQGMRQDFSHIANYYSDKETSGTLQNCVNYLHQAVYLTGDARYEEKMREIARLITATPPTDKELFNASSNFISTNIALACIRIYDQLFHRLTASERQSMEELMLRILRHYYPAQIGSEENHIFDSHFWQQNMRVCFLCAYMLYDKAPYRDEVLPMLEYYYEIWTARAPDGGYNRDGVWHNSVSYFDTNVETLYYMPMILSYITDCDFLQHPWYQSAGSALLYTWPNNSKSCGFGDGNMNADEPTRVRLAFADFLARHTGDPLATWYAGQNLSVLRNDFLLRPDRMLDNYTYSTEEEPYSDKMIWYKDTGEAVMHSDLLHTDRNLSLSFRSSRYGCSAHTFANQNAFNVLYKGKSVFCNSGYYTKYGSPHHIMSYRHTRAHNTILVNGIGQAFDTEAWGNITRGLTGDHITYCLGNASQAYRDTSDFKGWVKNFQEAGISQTPENGFGATPLTKYLRHVWMLHPSIIVIYDELEASEAVRWNWLLHSPTAFKVEEHEQTLNTVNTEEDFATQTWLFSSTPYTLAQTDLFRVPPADSPTPEYPNQWHLSATVENSHANRFLFIMQVYDGHLIPAPITRDGNEFCIGEWRISAEMNCDQSPSVHITNQKQGVMFDYGKGDAQLPDGSTFRRSQPFSSVLYDSYKGTIETMEQSDYLPKHTRSNY